MYLKKERWSRSERTSLPVSNQNMEPVGPNQSVSLPVSNQSMEPVGANQSASLKPETSQSVSQSVIVIV